MRKILALAGLLAFIATSPACRTAPPASGEAISAAPAQPSSDDRPRTGDVSQLMSTPYQRSGPPKAFDLPEGGLALLGSVVAPTRATLSVRIPARISQALAVEGAMVAKGQLLIVLDDADMAAQLRTAEAGLASAKALAAKARTGLAAQQLKADADVETARSGLKQAEIHAQQADSGLSAARDEQASDVRVAAEGVLKAEEALKRAKETVKSLEALSSVGGVSRSELEGARTQLRVSQSDRDTAVIQADRLRSGSGGVSYRVLQAQQEKRLADAAVASARTGVRTAEAARRQLITAAKQDVLAADAGVAQAAAGADAARQNRNQSRLTSPISGLVTASSARPGETAQPGAPLVTIVSLAGMRIDALVPGRVLSQLHLGQRAMAAVDSSPGKRIDAVIGAIARVAEPDGRTFRVQFRVVDAAALRPGQTARIRVLAAK